MTAEGALRAMEEAVKEWHPFTAEIMEWHDAIKAELAAKDARIAELEGRDRALRPCDCDDDECMGSDVITVCHDCGGYPP